MSARKHRLPDYVATRPMQDVMLALGIPETPEGWQLALAYRLAAEVERGAGARPDELGSTVARYGWTIGPVRIELTRMIINREQVPSPWADGLFEQVVARAHVGHGRQFLADVDAAFKEGDTSRERLMTLLSRAEVVIEGLLETAEQVAR